MNEHGRSFVVKKSEDQYSPDEAEKRLQMALRGARITGHKPMSEMKRNPKRKPAAAKPRATKRAIER
jgi:hypothetical protein